MQARDILLPAPPTLGSQWGEQIPPAPLKRGPDTSVASAELHAIVLARKT